MTNNIKTAISAANKFHHAIQKSFKTRSISYECKIELELTYTLPFLKAIKQRKESKIRMLEKGFVHECSKIDFAYSRFKNQIESDEKLFYALAEYLDSISRLRKEIQMREIAKEIKRS